MVKCEQADVCLDCSEPAARACMSFARFGRVQEQKWVMGASTVKDRYQYQYDASGNRTYWQNAQHTAYGGVQGDEQSERATIMKRTHLITVLVGVVAIGIFATNASAYYHPGMGRFTSRDPGAGVANRVGAAGTAPVSGFIPRDQYRDGPNLYQYVRSNPINALDAHGLVMTHLYEDQFSCDEGDRAAAFRTSDHTPNLVQTTTDATSPEDIDTLLKGGHAVAVVIRYSAVGGMGLNPSAKIAAQMTKPENMKRYAEAYASRRYLWIRLVCGKCECKKGKWLLAWDPPKWFPLDFGLRQGMPSDEFTAREIALTIQQVRIEKCGLNP